MTKLIDRYLLGENAIKVGASNIDGSLEENAITTIANILADKEGLDKLCVLVKTLEYILANDHEIGVKSESWIREKLREAQDEIKKIASLCCSKPVTIHNTSDRRKNQRRSEPERRGPYRRYRNIGFTGQFGRRTSTDRRKS